MLEYLLVTYNLSVLFQRLDQHDVSFDNAAQELNETAEMLLKQDEEIKDSLNETSVLLMKSDETLNKTLSGR